jgi:uncharacterized protein involved in cysteine biosynthesis
MYEHKTQPVAPLHVFYGRIFRNFVWMTIILILCLGIGVIGYHFTDHVPWIDSIHNASMILSGMGPVVELKSVEGKLFSSAYAIFSGIAFITNISFLLAPAVHRFFHKLHVEQ